jgi:histidinol-phosphate phosphatase family protein
VTEPRSRRAALLDRDGTINVDVEFLSDPKDVELLPGAARAIRRLTRAGYPVLVFTNQSGIARGIISLSGYHAVRRRLDELLAAEGAAIVDTFTCPHHPDFSGPCDCRKPGIAMYERAAVVHDLDLSRCLFIGDRMRDVNPARIFGGRGALVRSHQTMEAHLQEALESGVPVVDTLDDAVTFLLPDLT